MTNYVTGSGNTGASVNVLYYPIASTASTQVSGNFNIKTTTDWTQYTLTFTTDANTYFLTPELMVNGNSGAATLIMDAWFDDIVVRPTSDVTTRTAA